MKGSPRKQAEKWRPPTGRWSLAEAEGMVAALKASGLSMRKFAALHGLRTHRVSYWRAKLASDGGAPRGAGGFVAVRVAGEMRGGVERRVEVELLSGRRLTIHGDWDEATVGAWIRALETTP